MEEISKLGFHVSAQRRDGFGIFENKAPVIVSFDPGAFDEHPDAIKIFRTHAIWNHKDAPGDFDKMADKFEETGDETELRQAAEFWWFYHLEPIFRKIRNQYGDDVYFQPTNEINRKEILVYLDHMIEFAEEGGYRLALLGDAGDSPKLDLWVDYWLPFLKKHSGKNHIYSRHAYSGVNPIPNSDKSTILLTDPKTGLPTDANSRRPFVELEILSTEGIDMPMVITELGHLAGWNPVPQGWEDDVIRYNKLMMKYDKCWGAALWNLGQWEGNDSFIRKSNLIDLHSKTSHMTMFRPSDTNTNGVGSGSNGSGPVITEEELNSLSIIQMIKDEFNYGGIKAVTTLLPQDVPLYKVSQNNGYSENPWSEVADEIDNYRKSTIWSHHDSVSSLICAKLAGNECLLNIYGQNDEAVRLAELFDIPYKILQRPDVNHTPEDQQGKFEPKFWPAVDRTVTQFFGQNYDYYFENFGLPGHEGVDIRALHGSPIFSIADGVVKTVIDERKNKENGGHNYGVHIRISHEEGVELIYAHLDRRVVNKGDKVEAGQIIGYADNTGNSFGSHLHLTMKKDGVIVNPFDYIERSLQTINMPILKDKFNMSDYLFGDGRQWNLRSSQNGKEHNETCQTQYENGKIYHVKNNHWEELWESSGFIWRGFDTSRGGGTLYKMTDENGKYGAPWIPDKMTEGQSYTRTAFVTVYDFSGNVISGPTKVVDTMTLVKVHDSIEGLNGITINDVAELKWNHGESYFYGKGYGLVAWGRDHFDPNTPNWSRISEDHGKTRRDLVREKLGFSV